MTPAGRPRAKPPTVAVSGRSATVRWRAAIANGAPVARWRVDISAGQDRTLKAALRRTTFTRLRPGRYTVRIQAANRLGWGAWTSRVSFRVR